MKRAILAALLLCAVGSMSGCCVLDRVFCCRQPRMGCGDGCGAYSDGGCDSCGMAANGRHGDGRLAHHGRHGGGRNGGGYGNGGGGYGNGGGYGDGNGNGGFAPGPATAAVTYPYYTNRGPRDFLAKSPPSIGP